jgi:hypothetical protein
LTKSLGSDNKSCRVWPVEKEMVHGEIDSESKIKVSSADCGRNADA